MFGRVSGLPKKSAADITLKETNSSCQMIPVVSMPRMDSAYNR